MAGGSGAASDGGASAIVAMAVKVLAEDVQRALAGFDERLGAMEAVCTRFAEAREAEVRAQEGSLAQLGTLAARMDGFEAHMRDLLRGVQLLRDKDELREAQKELERVQLRR